jgi:hypothetical protein
VSKVLGVTSPRVLGQQVNRVRKKESYNGDDAGCYKKFAVTHGWQHREKAKAELRVADALGISSDRQKWEDRRDADDLKQGLRKRQGKNSCQLRSPIGSRKKENATNQIGNVMRKTGHVSELHV